jgi:radical SAM superfamily enzyme YgiQ (UPF0313 family)
MSKPKIYFADLTHTAQGISAATFPLGISYVLSYAKKHLGADFEVRLFKFPAALEEAIAQAPPKILSFSNYSWNLEISYKMASLAKARDPQLITVFGGPNFPILVEEKLEFLKARPDMDFYIELEGELGFVDLVKNLENRGFDASLLKESGDTPLNTNYLWKDQITFGRPERIKDLEEIPSPYLTGAMDEFFELPLVPMIETTRGCPFSCTFCADGIEMKNKVIRHPHERTKEELEYIASRVDKVEELIITDLNFAMYKQDLDTANAVQEVQKTHGYPTLISASAGKNKPERTIEVAGIVKGWTLGASIQSTDPDVLKAIKRSNISSQAYQELIEYGNQTDNSKTHSEIILGLPGDSREKHFTSLKFGVDNNVNSMRMFQAMLLVGTDMASKETRVNFGLITKFRTIPGCVGIYDFFGETHPVAEIEEIIVGSESLPVEDYADCRVMNLFLETFHNNAMFEELFTLVRHLGASPFECLTYVKEHPEDYSPRIQEIIAAFSEQTTMDLYDSFEEAQNHVLTKEVIEKYIGGELGTNELLLHRAMLYTEFEDISRLLFIAATITLSRAGLLTEQVEEYLEELQRFIVLRKQDLFSDSTAESKMSFIHDFEMIQKAGFAVDPGNLETFDAPQEFRFYHDPEQKKHIANQVRMYSNTPIGLGRLIQRSNLKLIYRLFSRTDSSLAIKASV